MYVWLNGANKLCDFCINFFVLLWCKCADFFTDKSRIFRNPRGPPPILEITNTAGHWKPGTFHYLIGDSKSYLSGLPRLRINVWAYFGRFFLALSWYKVQKGHHMSTYKCFKHWNGT